MRRIAPLLAAVTLFVIGCGSSTSAKPATTVATGASPATTAASGSSSSSLGDGATSTTKAPSYSGSSSSSFCDLARNVQQTQTRGATTPSDLKAAYAEFNRVADQFVPKAPSAIKADSQVLIDGVRKIGQALQDANFDFTKVDPAAMQGVNTPEFRAASQRVTAYLSQVCHVGTSTTSTP